MKVKRIFLLFLLGASLTGCHVGRFVVYNFSGINDYKKFPEAEVAKGEETFAFVPATDEANSLNLPEWWPIKDKRYDFAEAMEKSKTVAFIVIRNDSILYEEYFNGYDRESIVTSFSVVKSFVSALMGIAIEEGYVDSVDDPITKYLDYLEDPAFAKITIEHALNMESGIDFNESYYSPFSDAAKFYYGRQLEKYLTKLEVARPPGESFQYRSVNTVLLAQIIEKATGMPLNEYMTTRLWEKLDPEYPASLSMDKKDGIAKAFAGLNARAIDFAKFGRLFLNEGKWQGEQIVPVDWVRKSGQLDAGKDFHQYSYQWWKPRYYQSYSDTVTYTEPYRIVDSSSGNGKLVVKPVDYYSAVGHLGQYIAVVPEKNIVAVRFGKKEGNLDWYQLMQWIAANNDDGKGSG